MNSVPEKIIIKSVNWIGDSVLITPAIHAIKETYPKARLVMIARPWVADVFRANPALDDLWVVNEKSHWKAFVNLTRRLRRVRFDLGVVFPNSFSSALMFFIGGVKRRIGYKRDARGLLLNQSIKVTEEILSVHQVEYYLNLLKDICNIDKVDRKPRLYLNQFEISEMSEWLETQGVTKSDFIVGLNPGAFYGSAKRWLPERYAQVARYMIDHYGAKVAILGTNHEIPLSDEVRSHAKIPMLNFTGKMTTRQLMAFIQRCNFFLTNDSGAMHIAAAFDVPMVAIFGSTDWVTTPPFSDKAVITREPVECAPCLLRECPIDHRCMTNVSVEKVIAAIDERMAKYYPHYIPTPFPAAK